MDLTDDVEYADLDLSDVRAGAEPWRRRRFVRCRFEEADLRGLVTESCTFDECGFTADTGVRTTIGCRSASRVASGPRQVPDPTGRTARWTMRARLGG